MNLPPIIHSIVDFILIYINHNNSYQTLANILLHQQKKAYYMIKSKRKKNNQNKNYTT